jgi:hypothetical protein
MEMANQLIGVTMQEQVFRGWSWSMSMKRALREQPWPDQALPHPDAKG